MPPRSPLPSPSRRQLCLGLGALGIAVLGSACTGGKPARPVRSGPDPARALLTDTADLLARYDATAAAHPSLAARLRPLRDQHEQHRRALQAMLGLTDVSPSVSATASTSTSTSPSASTSSAALAALRAAEIHTAQRLAAAALTAPPSRCALLASMSASNASHGAVLR